MRKMNSVFRQVFDRILSSRRYHTNLEKIFFLKMVRNLVVYLFDEAYIFSPAKRTTSKSESQKLEAEATRQSETLNVAVNI